MVDSAAKVRQKKFQLLVPLTRPVRTTYIAADVFVFGRRDPPMITRQLFSVPTVLIVSSNHALSDRLRIQFISAVGDLLALHRPYLYYIGA
jgi:hypothetical protein